MNIVCERNSFSEAARFRTEWNTTQKQGENEKMDTGYIPKTIIRNENQTKGS